MNRTYSFGFGIGNLIAFYISAFVANNTIGWIILQTLFSWFYVIYYLVGTL